MEPLEVSDELESLNSVSGKLLDSDSEKDMEPEAETASKYGSKDLYISMMKERGEMRGTEYSDEFLDREWIKIQYEKALEILAKAENSMFRVGQKTIKLG